MNAAKELYERDRSTAFGDGNTFKTDVENKRKKMQLYQSESHKMKAMMMSSAGMRASGNDPTSDRAINPLWVNFPTRCVKPITTTEELKRKLEYYTSSDEVMIIRYHQNNCTACNALDKSFEYSCHESAKRFTKMHYYDINKDEVPPEMTRGLVRFPQVKGYSGGQWVDLEFKPPTEFREQLYSQVEKEVRARKSDGRPVTALQAEEMYFSAAGPSMYIILSESISKFYTVSQVRLHNYWKQVSVRRSWFFKKFVEPNVEEKIRDEWAVKSVFGEKTVYGPALPEVD